MINRFPILIIIAILLTLSIAHAENIVFVKEYTYQASEFDSKHSSRILALEQLKRALLEELGTYLISETEVKDFHLTKDQITIYTAGFVITEVVDENWDGKSYWLKARLSADPNEVVKSIDAIRQDIKKSRELYIAQKRADELEKELERLKKDLTEKPDGMKIKEYNDKVNKLNALDWLMIAFANLEGSEENIKANPQKAKDAIDALTKVIEIVPNYSLAFHFRGFFIAVYLNEYKRAIEDLNKAIEYNHWNEKDINIASSTMKCNTWEAERRNAILSVYGKTIQSPNLVRKRSNYDNAV